MNDVLIVGAGPSGTALGSACVRLGLKVTVVDEHPDRPWRCTYGAWSDELPSGTPVVATSSCVRVVTNVEHVLARSYSVLDNDRLRGFLTVPDLRTRTGRVVSAVPGPSGTTVVLADGTELVAPLVVDASGHRRTLTRTSRTRAPAVQTAYGVMVPEELARPLVRQGEVVLMDWSPPEGSRGTNPTFLYSVPLGGGRVLLQETSLAHRSGVSFHELRKRLSGRLAAHGVFACPGEVEKVRFPLDTPLPTRTSPPAFGAAAAMTHPATGYGVATALQLAPRAAEAIAASLPSGSAAVGRALYDAVWPRSARAVHRLRHRGLNTLLTMPSALVPQFFAAYFSVRADWQKAYLSGRSDVVRTATAMAAMFRTSDWPVRMHAVKAVLGR